MRSGVVTEEQGRQNVYAIEPQMYVSEEAPRFGFTPYAELLNGRLAMIGFVSAIAVELLTGHGVLGFFSGI